MTCRAVSALFVGLVLRAASARAQTPNAPAIPNTPAGNVLDVWLNAYKSADSTLINTYVRTYRPEQSVHDILYFRKATGGFELLSIELSGPRHIEFTFRERNGAMVGYGTMDVSVGDPVRVTGSALEALGRNMPVAALRINASTRMRIVDGATALLDPFYVFPTVAKRMGDSVRARLARGVSDSYGSGPGFAMRLNRDLGDITHDRHRRVNYSVPVLLTQRAQDATPSTMTAELHT